MTDEHEDHPALDGYPTDDDYCGVEKRRADVSDDTEFECPHCGHRDCRCSRGEQAKAAESARERFDYGDGALDSDEDERALGASERPVRDADGAERTDMSHRFGRHAAGLAGSDYDQKIDEDAPREHDGRAETRTGFDPREAPAGERDKWRRLNTLNDDGRHPDRRTQNRSSDRRRWVQTFCTHLDMTGFQRERTQHIVEGLNVGHMAHYSSQMVILGAISLVANEDDRWIRDEDAFRGLMRDVDVTLRELKRIRHLIRQKSDGL